ncbi:MAG: SRPBCC domain-containing protein [Proteobacteria bacterium]|nr:SRPBCC domain-containing protein [Pseudomonadota bacterium]
MSRTIPIAPVRRTLTVTASPATAFDAFTADIGLWWPKSHHVSAVEPETVVIEARTGGRWFERAPGGVECDVGKVLAWEPPARLLLAWQLDANFRYQPDLVTEVEVRFIAEGDATRVEFEHRNLERFGAHAETVRGKIGAPQGWTAILNLYAGFASR